jgi:serine/threonine protein kinase
LEHPNIIKTYKLQNSGGEAFLVEKRLRDVLNDDWRSKGIHEAANLLRDMASALTVLQNRGLIHGDVKPDNIGFEDGRYILLDFGICRLASEFTSESTPTGSLRTRAPELILNEGVHSAKCDVWALGATVFNSVVGRFPLFQADEKPPRISTPEERSEFEKKLVRRVNAEWSTYVDFTQVPEPLRSVLVRALERDPAKRPEINDLLGAAESELAAFLRKNEGADRFSPAIEIEQLMSFLPESSLKSMPESKRRQLKARLEELGRSKGLDEKLTSQADALCRNLA